MVEAVDEKVSSRTAQAEPVLYDILTWRGAILSSSVVAAVCCWQHARSAELDGYYYHGYSSISVVCVGSGLSLVRS